MKIEQTFDDAFIEDQLAVKQWLDTNKEKYQPHLEKAVRYHLQNILEYTQRRLVELEVEYSELTKKGRPFVERKTVGEKMHQAKLAIDSFKRDLSQLYVRDMSDWVEVDDIENIKKHGFLEAVGHAYTMMRCYYKVYDKI